jgi:protein-disulfide isomerase
MSLSRRGILAAAGAAALGVGLASGEDRLVEGNRSSAVRVLIFEDLQCSDCAVLRRMLDTGLLPRFGATAAFEHRDFPLPKHSWARPAAIAARFFESVRPELGLEYRRATLGSMKQTTAETFRDKLAAFAKAHDVDPAKALAALSDAKLAALVEADVQEGIARGVQKTPTVFVNGQPFVETFTIEEISKAIDEAGK